MAALRCNLGIFESLIKRVRIDDDYDLFACRKVLRGVVEKGHIEISEKFQKEKIDLSSTFDGKTVLQLAATFGDLRTVEVLLETGADVNVDAVGGYPALLGAVERGHIGIVRRLAKEGLDINHSYDGRTALQVAMERGDSIMASRIADLEAWTT